jgi:hypothetical protein
MIMRNRIKRILWLASAACVTGVAFFLSRFPATNVAETRPDHEDSLLRTRRYAVPMAEAGDCVRAMIPALRTYGRHWDLVSSVKSPGTGGAATEMFIAVEPVLFFRDDMVVTLHGDDKSTTVDVRSAARVGKGDLGENRRHVVQLLAALDAALASKTIARS